MSRQPVERRIALNNADLCYFDWEGSDASTVLLLHATGFHARCWDKTIDELPDTCRVIALDLRGHGRSSKIGPFGWFDFGEDVAEFIEALDLQDVVIAGHSMGGHCGLFASAQAFCRIKALVLVDPVILTPDQYPNQDQAMRVEDHPIARRRNRWQSPDEMFDNFTSRQPFCLWRPEVLRDYCDYGLLRVADGFELACPPHIEAQIYMGTGRRDLSYLFPRITQPVVVMRARQQTTPRRPMDFSKSPTWPGLAGALPNARDRSLPELSHFIPMQRPDLVADEIQAFLAS